MCLYLRLYVIQNQNYMRVNRVGVKYTLLNTNTNTFFLKNQIQIQIFIIFLYKYILSNTNINTLNIKSYDNILYKIIIIIYIYQIA